MAEIMNYNIGKNVNYRIFLKKITFFFLVLSYLTYNDVSPLCKILENIFKQDSTSNTKITRLLAKYEQVRELERTKLREKLLDRRAYKSERNLYDNLSAYYGAKSKALNNIDIYMKNYRNRYMRKKGLSKLDCYYENKVFSKFNHMCGIGEKMKYDEKRSKKFFLKKYGKGFILFALIPVLGFIFRILFGFSRNFPGILGPCPDNHFGGTETKKHKTYDGKSNCSSEWMETYHTLIEILEGVNMIFTIIMVSIVILFFIYILIKVIKYEKIKAGKGKMNMKEYCRFCKDIL